MQIGKDKVDLIGLQDDSESDELKEYSSPEDSGDIDLCGRRSAGSESHDSEGEEDDPDNQIELPPSIESSPNSECDDYNNDQIDTEIIEALKAHTLDPEEENNDQEPIDTAEPESEHEVTIQDEDNEKPGAEIIKPEVIETEEKLEDEATPSAEPEVITQTDQKQHSNIETEETEKPEIPQPEVIPTQDKSEDKTTAGDESPNK
jgi:hypothetical protein